MPTPTQDEIIASLGSAIIASAERVAIAARSQSSGAEMYARVTRELAEAMAYVARRDQPHEFSPA